MKQLFILIGLLLTCFCQQLSAQINSAAFIPMPNSCRALSCPPLVLGRQTKIYVNDVRLDFTAGLLTDILLKRMNIRACITHKKSEKAGIRLLLTQGGGKEAYSLRVDSKELCIAGATCQAVQHGVMTTDQLLLGNPMATEKHKLLPVQIDDSPRFAYRALMLDPARHFLPAADIKRYIDRMIRYKFNVLQLHLTDDQGWRMEVKGYPKLTEAGPYYTQEELKDLIDYAAKRQVEIIPELDIPGHTASLLAAYPQLGCTVNDTLPITIGKTTDRMLCCAQKEVYTLYRSILEQAAAIFPSPYIHLGGDEAAVEKNWALCERCRLLMKERGYTKASQLMIPFFDRMLSVVRKAGKRAILWCELNNIYPPADNYLFPYPKDVTLVSWRGGLTPTCIDIAGKEGNTLILAPGEYTYFDYPQLKGDLPEYNNWGMPVTTLQQAYAFDPGYNLPKEKQQHLAGVMGTLWGEAICDIHRATYMTYPRALALAEAGWTEMSNRSWTSFKTRIFPNLYDMMQEGISFRVPYEICNP